MTGWLWKIIVLYCNNTITRLGTMKHGCTSNNSTQTLLTVQKLLESYFYFLLHLHESLTFLLAIHLLMLWCVDISAIAEYSRGHRVVPPIHQREWMASNVIMEDTLQHSAQHQMCWLPDQIQNLNMRYEVRLHNASQTRFKLFACTTYDPGFRFFRNCSLSSRHPKIPTTTTCLLVWTQADCFCVGKYFEQILNL